MKLTILLLFITSLARAVTLEWDDPEDVTVVSWKVYGRAKGSTEWSLVGTPGVKSFTYSQPNGEWAWAVSAVNNFGLESPKSEPIATAGFMSKPIPRLVDGTVIVPFANLNRWKNYQIEMTTDLTFGNWAPNMFPISEMYNIEVLAPAIGQRFFRIREVP